MPSTGTRAAHTGSAHQRHLKREGSISVLETAPPMVRVKSETSSDDGLRVPPHLKDTIVDLTSESDNERYEVVCSYLHAFKLT